METNFKIQIAYALRNYAESWEIRQLARDYIKNVKSA